MNIKINIVNNQNFALIEYEIILILYSCYRKIICFTKFETIK